jgi:hypothetical protein
MIFKKLAKYIKFNQINKFCVNHIIIIFYNQNPN